MMEKAGRQLGLWTAYYLLLLILYGQGGLCDEKKVYEDVITANHYNTKVRPRHNSSEKVLVELELELRQITGLDQQNQILYFSGFVVAQWHDEYLSWDPDKYGGTDNLIIPPNKVWLPDFGIINSASTFYQSSFTTDFRVHVNHTGHILWAFGGNFATACALDITYFPFDRQVCKVVIENWAYEKAEVELRNMSSHVHLDDFHTNGEWDLEHTSVVLEDLFHDIFPGTPFPKMSFNMYLRRKSGYYALNILAPCFYMISVALAMFWLPADSGEKVGVGVTVLLAFSVFQLVVADSSPKTSDSFPILSLYVSFVMGMSTVSTTTAIICLYFHHHLPNKPVSRWVRLVFFKYLGYVLCMRDIVPVMAPTNGVKPQPGEKNNLTGSHISMKNVPNGPVKDEDFTEAEHEILVHLRYVTDQMKQQDQDTCTTDEWKALARVVDRCFFYICLVIIITVCLYMLTQQEAPLH